MRATTAVGLHAAWLPGDANPVHPKPIFGGAMLYVFTSTACPSVTYLGSVAEEILKLAGKSPGPMGVITAAEIPAVTARLREAVAAREQAAVAPVQDTHDGDEPEEPAVPLAKRLTPFLELLRCASAAGKDVTWGV